VRAGGAYAGKGGGRYRAASSLRSRAVHAVLQVVAPRKAACSALRRAQPCGKAQARADTGRGRPRARCLLERRLPGKAGGANAGVSALTSDRPEGRGQREVQEARAKSNGRSPSRQIVREQWRAGWVVEGFFFVASPPFTVKQRVWGWSCVLHLIPAIKKPLH